MIIADLNHLETVKETQIVGAGVRYIVPSAIANAFADSQAVGAYTLTSSTTLTQAASGVFSRSISSSLSVAVG